jgi:hypothetical protein
MISSIFFSSFVTYAWFFFALDLCAFICLFHMIFEGSEIEHNFSHLLLYIFFLQWSRIILEFSIDFRKLSSMYLNQELGFLTHGIYSESRYYKLWLFRNRLFWFLASMCWSTFVFKFHYWTFRSWLSGSAPPTHVKKTINIQTNVWTNIHLKNRNYQNNEN